MILVRHMNRLEKEKILTMIALAGFLLLAYAWGQIKSTEAESVVIRITEASGEDPEETLPEKPTALQIRKEKRYEQKTGQEKERAADRETACFQVLRQDIETDDKREETFTEGTLEAQAVEFQDKGAYALSAPEVSGEIQEGAGCDGIQNPDVEEPETVLAHKVETSGTEPPGEDITSQTEAPAPAEETAAAVTVLPLYSVNGAVLAEDLQTYLYNALASRGIGWFFPYAIMIAYQESRFDPRAENKNGLDKGLYQYRVTYWSYGDIMSPYDQINVFVQQMAQRAAAGCSVPDMISRHKQSDWGSYDQVYVGQVMQWERVLARIR